MRAQAPKLPKHVLDALDRVEIDRLEDAARTERDKVIVRLLATSGIRAGELLGLTPADLVEQGRDRFIRVHGKGARERLVPIQPQLYRRLQRVARGRPADARSDGLFVALRRSGSGCYMRCYKLWNVVQRRYTL